MVVVVVVVVVVVQNRMYEIIAVTIRETPFCTAAK